MKTRCIGAFLPIKLLSSHSVQGSNFSLTDSFLHTTSCTRQRQGYLYATYMPPPVLPLLAYSCIPEKPQDANPEFPSCAQVIQRLSQKHRRLPCSSPTRKRLGTRPTTGRMCPASGVRLQLRYMPQDKLEGIRRHSPQSLPILPLL